MMFNQYGRRRIYELNIRPYPGLIVRARKPGFTALEKLTSAVRVLGDDLSGAELPAIERVSAWGKLHRAFAASLVSWTLTDGDQRVPTTTAGVLDQDPEFLLELARTWYAVVVLRDPAIDTEQRAAPADDDDADDAEDEFEQSLASIPTATLPSTEDGAAA